MKTDQEINALVAEKVAGLKGVEMYARIEGTPLYGVLRKSSNWDRPDVYDPIPDFVNSADAVLPLLEPHYVEMCSDEHGFTVTLYRYYRHGLPQPEHIIGRGQADAFARAACYALLKSKGIEL